MSHITDMAREVAMLLAERQEVEIRTGSLPGLVRAIHGSVGLNPSDVQDVPTLSFMGINVVENDMLPDDTAVIMSDGEVINIIKFGQA